MWKLPWIVPCTWVPFFNSMVTVSWDSFIKNLQHLKFWKYYFEVLTLILHICQSICAPIYMHIFIKFQVWSGIPNFPPKSGLDTNLPVRPNFASRIKDNHNICQMEITIFLFSRWSVFPKHFTFWRNKSSSIFPDHFIFPGFQTFLVCWKLEPS